MFATAPLPRNSQQKPVHVPEDHQAVVDCLNLLEPLLQRFAKMQITEAELKKEKVEKVAEYKKFKKADKVAEKPRGSHGETCQT